MTSHPCSGFLELFVWGRPHVGISIYLVFWGFVVYMYI